MNAEQIIGRATQEEVMDLMYEGIGALTNENLSTVLANAVDPNILEEVLEYQRRDK